jgi:superfamily II DNA/RNA helicase/HKD family nuclease
LVNSDITFLTNEDERKLSTRLSNLLSKSNRFDCLVGYFYLSGFYLIRKSLEPCEKIRILIGLETESQVLKALQRAKIQPEFDFHSNSETVKEFSKVVLEQLETAEETAEVETGIEQFVRWCAEGKVEVRAYDKHKIHAKLYIFTFNSDQVDKGRVITGSSNLSLSGLHDNLEFNVELKNRSDYEFAAAKFEELWKDSVEVSENFVRTVKNESHLAQFSPFELYLKFLYEYFRTELNSPRELDQDYQPENFMRLQYQHDAVLTAKRIVEEYDGVFLADVVGLGKTYMAAMLARELNGRSLVIAPPALIDKNNPGAWQNVFHDFGVRGFHAESVGKLDAILKLDLSKFQYVFIDEAHRFRNEDNETYAKLHRICRNKKVVLVTATPFNNRPNDLLSQLKLFQNSRSSTLPNLPNLDNFFRNLNSRLSQYHRVADREEYLRVMRENAREVRERILKYLMVRRTRSEISRFYDEDLTKQNLKFPEVETPQSVYYELSKRENEIFTRTIERIAKQITYARYRPLVEKYFRGELDENTVTAQNNLAGFMKVLLVKRLESSFEAFRKTLGRFIAVYEKYIAAYRSGYVYVSKKKTNVIFDLIEAGDFNRIEKIIESEEAERYDAKDFDSQFFVDLKSDLETLQAIRADWHTVDRDPKWEKFLSLLKNEPTFQKTKLLLFTESKETAEYLCRRIADSFDEDALCFTGSSKLRMRETVIDNFDARAKPPKDNFRILLTTDTLAEGVSLHRSNVVINYDIPWNPTRMMQRVGRINRVDTRFDRVFTYNFFPSEEGNNEIGLREAAEAKIEAFIEMLGTDARLLTENEEIKSFNLFDRITSKETLTGESDADETSELKYLKFIRDIQENQKELFARIKKLPRKARAANNLPEYTNALLTYFRLGKLDKFYLANGENAFAQEIDFLEAAKILETDNQNKTSVGKDFFALLKKNQDELAKSLEADRETTHAPLSNRDAATKLQRRLFVFKPEQMQDFTDTEDKFWQDAISALRDGAVAKKTVNKVWKTVEKISDARGVLEVLKKNLSLNGLANEEPPPIKKQIKIREVILSEHLL